MKPTNNNGFTIEEPQNKHVIQASVSQTEDEYWEEYWDNQLTYSTYTNTPLDIQLLIGIM